MGNLTVTKKIGDTYKDWIVGGNIILDCAMGRGKTFFIVNVLGEYAEQQGKQILYLCNRSKLAEEVFSDVRETWATNITVKTYQTVQKDIQQGKEMKVYDYIVCDECHYMLTDGWNDKTDIMYIWLHSNKLTVKLFMSATGDDIFKIIRQWKECIEYKLEPDYSYIKKIVFYDNDSYIERVIEELEEDEKLIYFSRKAEKAYKLHQRYENSSFVMSESTKDHKELIPFINRGALIRDKISKKPILSNQLTFTTSVWDNGINIKDDDLKHIICDFDDMVKLIQAIGRKRVGKIEENEFILSNADNVILHIRNWNKENLTQFVNPKRAMYNECTKFLMNDKEWIQEQNQKRDKKLNECLHPDYATKEIKINFLRYEGLRTEKIRLEDAIEHGFDKQVLDVLGNSFVGEVEYVSIEQEKKASDIEILGKYLDSIVGSMLFNNERQQLKDEFENAGLKDRTMGINTLNGKLLDEKLKFTIISDDDNRRKLEDGSANPNRRKRYWQVVKVC